MLGSRIILSTLLVFFCIGIGAKTGHAAEPPFVVHETKTHVLESKFIDQTFEIYVQVPWSRADETERFPVLYMTDCYGDIDYKRDIHLLQYSGEIPRIIAVGIGYKMDTPLQSTVIRARDLTPTESESYGKGRKFPNQLFKNWPDPELEKATGGGPDFLRFIREELQPFIDKNYPTMPEDRGFWGDSLGGLFGLYVLFQKPDTFNRYIIGSPSIWWDDNTIVNDAEAFIDSHERLDADVFMSIGEDEPTTMVPNMLEMAERLREANLTGLNLKTHVFPGETHISVISANFIRGLRNVYPKPDKNIVLQMMSRPKPKE